MMTSASTTGVRLCRLGPVDQIPLGEGRAFVVGDEQMAVFRLRDGGLRAVAATCPHRGGPLADGLVDGEQVICPLHSHAFRLADGQCATGEWSIQTYQVTVEDGELVLRMYAWTRVRLWSKAVVQRRRQSGGNNNRLA